MNEIHGLCLLIIIVTSDDVASALRIMKDKQSSPVSFVFTDLILFPLSNSE